MLQPYLREYTAQLEEQEYRVVLRDQLQHAANAAYSEGDYYSAPWFGAFWRSNFIDRLRAAGVQVAARSKVLDACCGLGYLGEALEREYQADVVYCDLSEPQIAALCARMNPNRVTPINVRIGDLLDLPCENNAFDLVVGNSFLHHLPDVTAGLAELARVAKPGAYVAVLHEPSLTATFWESFPLSLWKDCTLKSGGFTDLWLFNPQELGNLAAAAGLEDIQILGTGIVSSLLLNWYLIVAEKLRWEVPQAYTIKRWLNRIDLAFQPTWKIARSPSLILAGRKASSTSGRSLVA